MTSDVGIGMSQYIAGVIVHRMGGEFGGADGELENTLAGLDDALRHMPSLGGIGIEYDVRGAIDALVVHHDAEVETIPIQAASYDGLPPVRGVPVLRWDELLDHDAGPGLLHNPELKVAGIEQAVVASLIAKGIPPERAIITSFIPDVVESINRLETGYQAGLLVDHTAGMGLEQAREIASWAYRVGARFVAPHISIIDETLLDVLGRGGLPVVPWTVNDRADLLRLMADRRVSFVITDRADVAASVVAELRSRSVQ